MATRPRTVPATSYPQRDLQVRSLRIRYIDVPAVAPSTRPPLLLLHGLASRIEEFEEMIPVLMQNQRVLVLDLPGSGYSDKPDRPYSLRGYEDSVLAFLDTLGVHEVNVAGGSLGGNLTLRLGHRAPERFARLVAWSPAGVWEPRRWVARVGRVLRGRALFWPVVWAQSREWFDPEWPGRDAALREAFALYREVMCDGFVRMYWDLVVAQLAQSLFPIAPQTRQPTLLARGENDDGLSMKKGMERLQSLLPRAELQIFPKARHSLAAEAPLPLARSIQSFLEARA